MTPSNRLPLPWVQLAVALLAFGLGGCEPSTPKQDRLDVVLLGGTLIDGNGAAPRIADIGLRGDRIVAIGELSSVEAARVLDADGLVVAPGFIDLHSHADGILLGDAETRDRLLQAKLRQGVTTVIVGNCGLGPTPTDESTVDLLRGINAWMTPAGVRPEALSFADFLLQIESAELPVHVGSLVAHGPIRIAAMGLEPGGASLDALEQMRSEVRLALDAGAFGLSVGLIYPPGMFTPTEELVALAEEVARRDRLFTAHIRGSSELLIPATQELIGVAESSGARVHHSHLEAVGRPFWGGIADVLRIEDEARARGVRISHDLFPYSRAATMMVAIFPPWSLEGGVPALLERLSDPSDRERIRLAIEGDVPAWPPWVDGGWPHNLVAAVGWDGIRVASLPADAEQDLVGASLQEIAEALVTTPFDAVADLMLEHDGQIGQWVDEISGAEDERAGLMEILAHPAGAIVTDAEDFGRGSPHPAHAGAFPRALRWNREAGLGSLQEMIRRMTGYPASLLGLSGRGTIAVGMQADLVVFDPAVVADQATWQEPRKAPVGFRWVLVDGQVAVEEDQRTSVRNGQLLRAGAS